MDALVVIVKKLVERARAGPLTDQRQIVENLHYIREQLEQVHQRHTVPRFTAEEEELRTDLLEIVGHLYDGLEELEDGIVEQEPERLDAALDIVTEALAALGGLEKRADELNG